MKQRTVSQYIGKAPAPARATLRRLRALIKATAQGAKEKISYGIPTFVLRGRMLIYLAGWEKHISIYPVTKAIERALKQEIKPYRTGKGTLQFSLARKIPTALIRKIVKVRIKELDETVR